MLASSSSTLVAMASQLSEAEEIEKGFTGRGRWNQVKSLVDGKNMMNHLLNLASFSRCMLRDKEVNCRDKDSEIRDLKGKIVNLSSLVRHLEKQKTELIHQVKLQNSALKNMDNAGRKYDLRKQPQRRSIFMMEDIDMSVSDRSDIESTEGDDGEWVRSDIKKTRRKHSRHAGVHQSTRDSSSPFSHGDGELRRTESGLCCSCSKKSLCKTTKCECRAAGGICGGSCGCAAGKCCLCEVEPGSAWRS